MRIFICKKEQPRWKEKLKENKEWRNRQREWNRKTKIAISFELVGEDLGANRSELESQDSVFAFAYRHTIERCHDIMSLDNHATLHEPLQSTCGTLLNTPRLFLKEKENPRENLDKISHSLKLESNLPRLLNFLSEKRFVASIQIVWNHITAYVTDQTGPDEHVA